MICIWQTGSHDRFLSAHIIVDELKAAERTKLLAKIIDLLKEKYNIHHSTLQMVSQREIKEIELECQHCN
jgi:cobalt-zinc-cadmium efflux system protein